MNFLKRIFLNLKQNFKEVRTVVFSIVYFYGLFLLKPEIEKMLLKAEINKSKSQADLDKDVPQQTMIIISILASVLLIPMLQFVYKNYRGTYSDPIRYFRNRISPIQE